MSNRINKLFAILFRKPIFALVAVLILAALVLMAVGNRKVSASPDGASVTLASLFKKPQTPGSVQTPPTTIWEFIDESSIVATGERQITPQIYKTVRANETALRELLAKAPMEFTEAA